MIHRDCLQDSLIGVKTRRLSGVFCAEQEEQEPTIVDDGRNLFVAQVWLRVGERRQEDVFNPDTDVVRKRVVVGIFRDESGKSPVSFDMLSFFLDAQSRQRHTHEFPCEET